MNIAQHLLPTLPPDLRIRRLGDGTAVGRFLRSDLSSVFQPIVDGAGVIVGYEAFVRAHGQGARDIAPWNLFALVAGDEALVALDRLCRVVHALNFLPHAETAGRLFLNVHGRLLAAVQEDHGHSFREAIELIGLDARRVVIETPESANGEAKLLALVLSNYRRNGFAVAANVRDADDLASLLAMVRPDYIKLDARGFRRDGALVEAIRRVEDHGARPVAMRVGDRSLRDRLLGMTGVLLQGFALAPPATIPWRQAAQSPVAAA